MSIGKAERPALFLSSPQGEKWQKTRNTVITIPS